MSSPFAAACSALLLPLSLSRPCGSLPSSLCTARKHAFVNVPIVERRRNSCRPEESYRFQPFAMRKRKRRRHPCTAVSSTKSDIHKDDNDDHRKESLAQEMLGIEKNNTMDPLMVFPLRYHPNQEEDELPTSSSSLESSRQYIIGKGARDDSDDIKDGDFLDQLPMSPMSSLSVDAEKSLPSNVYGELELAPASNIAYFYLQNKLGLSDEAMWKITLEAGSVLGMTSKNLDWKVSVLRRNMNLSDDDIREIITKHPTILHMSADKNIAPTILFLVRALDLGKADLRRMVLQYPCILCYSFDNLRTKINFFTHVMGFSIEETRGLVVGEPRLMCAGVKTGLMPRLDFLHKEMTIPLKTLQSIVRKNPRILLYSVEKNLRDKLISFFVFRLRMESLHIQKLLSSYPQILDYNLQDYLVPIAQYFMEDLEFSPTELRSILLKFPRLVSNSLRKIKHVVGYFRYELDLDASQVKRLIFQAPQICNLADTNLQSKVRFLRDTFDLDDDELRKVVVGMPTLMMCSIESNLRPKADYLLEAFDNDGSALKDAIITQPTLMGYSLDKRIKPRLDMIRSIGAHPNLLRVGISMTQANFEAWLINKEQKIANDRLELSQTKQKEKFKKIRIVKEPPIRAEDETVAEKRQEENPDWLKEEEKRREAERRKARIVHWKR